MGAHRQYTEGEVVLGKYRIVRKIGEGGMAFVYQATSHGVAGFTRDFVIKVIKPELASSRDLVRQFVQEASVGASLDHPNIVHVLDLGEHEGQLHMVLEYVAGKDLGALTRRIRRARRVIGPEMTAFLNIDVCKALEAAHGHIDHTGKLAPVIHRDVSPQNILLSYDGVVKLADFGLARALGVSRQTRQGIIKGKLSYMSPEQSRGREVDGRSDIFSLGTVMWETLSGRRLFLKKDQVDTIRQVRDTEAPPLAEVAPHVARDLGNIVHKALSKNPRDRFQDATEMRKALQTYMRTAKPVDPTALAGVLKAYFPAKDPAKVVADTALSFDDEGDFHGGDEPDTEVDVEAPSMDEVAAGASGAHTMVMFGEGLAAAMEQTVVVPDAEPDGSDAELRRTARGHGPAPSNPPGAAPTPAPEGFDGARTRLGVPTALAAAAQGPPVATTGAPAQAGPSTPPPATLLATPAALQATPPAASPGRAGPSTPPPATLLATPAAMLGAPPAASPAQAVEPSLLDYGETRLGIPPPATSQPAAAPGPAVPAHDGRTRLGAPAAPLPMGQPFAPAPSLAGRKTPIGPPPDGGAPSPASAGPATPAPIPLDRPKVKDRPGPRTKKKKRKRKKHAPAEDHSRALYISLILGIPLGIGVGALVFWLLTR